MSFETFLYIAYIYYLALLSVPLTDPNQPKPEGLQTTPLQGEPLGVVTNWPPSLLAALQRWGTTQPKAPCLTSLDTTGKPVYTLTYGMDLFTNSYYWICSWYYFICCVPFLF